MKEGTKTASPVLFSFNENETIMAMENTTDGGFIVATQVNNIHSVTLKGVLYKIDIDGNVLWKKTYGDTGVNEIFSVKPTSDGGYIACGRCTKNSITTGQGTQFTDAWVFKTNKDGDTLWEKFYGGKFDDAFFDIAQVGDEGYIVAGFTIKAYADQLHYFAKLDAQGNTVWDEKMHYSFWHDDGLAVAYNKYNGHYLFAGSIAAFYIFYSEFDASGKKIYTKKINNNDGLLAIFRGLNTYDYYRVKILVKPEGYIFGYSLSNFNGSENFAITNTQGFDSVIKWTKKYNFGGTTFLCDVINENDGYILTGSFSPGESKTVKTRIYGQKAFIARTDENGNIEWNNAFTSLTNSNKALAIRRRTDGQYLVAGNTTFTTNGGTKTFFARCDNLGQIK